MKKRIIIFTIISLTILLASFAMRTIVVHSDYYEISKIITYVCLALTFLLPCLILLLFFKKFVKIVAEIITVVFLLSLIYGFTFVGVKQMISDFLYLTIAFITSIVVLRIIIVKNKEVNKNLTDSEDL